MSPKAKSQFLVENLVIFKFSSLQDYYLSILITNKDYKHKNNMTNWLNFKWITLELRVFMQALLRSVGKNLVKPL